ncbi:response regulator [Candidatus Saccharibacteria bacterium]|nr:response regulator [Candidatus Saccharibacteria bacterium]
MAKIMLVEDDNNLREIYEARLLAEGYEIVSAKDGEEALAMAVKEKPDLIISDVMMPKISGFDMLDILRSTPETKNTKVIMMTALSQAEDKNRADKLGADRYLVKSQVTLEDVAKVAHEVLTGEEAPSPAPAAEPTTTTAPTPEPTAVAVAPVPEPAATPDLTLVMPLPVSDEPSAASPATTPAVDSAAAQTTADEESTITDQINQFVAGVPTEAPIEVATQPIESTEDVADNAAKLAGVVNDVMEQKDAEEATTGDVVAGKKVISPINDLNAPGPDLSKLAAEQDAKDTATAPVTTPTATSVITPEGEIVTPPEADNPDATPKTAETPPQPGDKIDPNSVAL